MLTLDTVERCIKFDDPSFSCSRDMAGASVVTVSKFLPSVGFGRFCRKKRSFRFSFGSRDKRTVYFFKSTVIRND